MGSQYTGDFFERILNRLGIKHYYSSKGCIRGNNIRIESFHSTLKRVDVDFQSFQTLDKELQVLIVISVGTAMIVFHWFPSQLKRNKPYLVFKNSSKIGYLSYSFYKRQTSKIRRADFHCLFLACTIRIVSFFSICFFLVLDIVVIECFV